MYCVLMITGECLMQFQCLWNWRKTWMFNFWLVTLAKQDATAFCRIWFEYGMVRFGLCFVSVYLLCRKCHQLSVAILRNETSTLLRRGSQAITTKTWYHEILVVSLQPDWCGPGYADSAQKYTAPTKDENKSPRLRHFNNLAYKCPSHLSNKDKEHHVSLKPRAPLCEVWAQSERKPQMAQRYKYDSRTDWHPPKWTKTVLKTMSASRYLHLLIFTTLAAKAHAGNPWTKQKSKQTNKNTNFYGWFISLVSRFTH